MVLTRMLLVGLILPMCWPPCAVRTSHAADTPPLTSNVAESDAEDARSVRSLLSNRCFACHGPDEEQRSGGFRLDQKAAFLGEADSGLPPVIPGDAENSELLRRINSTEEWERMPPPEFGEALSDEETELVRRWIESGAEWTEHWSFIPPTRPALPQVDDEIPEAWKHNPIDQFVYSKMQSRGLRPSQPATNAELERRVSLDLIGLPRLSPHSASTATIKTDLDYEQLVDELLASPKYGEHWARQWLDLARYADSAGYADDPPRTIWAYRDWVVRALNNDMPLDQFTIEQLAGDLLINPTEDQLIATAFHRNTLTNNEGGTNDEEFRNVAVVDRVNTTMAVWMGVTMACAQCHTHKYDPYTHEEYFKLFAIFNQTADADRRNEAPTLPIFTDEQIARKKFLQTQIAEQTRQLSRPMKANFSLLKPWAASLAEPKWKPLFTNYATRTKSEVEQLEAYRKELKNLKPSTTVPILSELAEAKQRKTFVQIRGNYRAHGDEVVAGVPEVFHPIETSNPAKRVNRLDLAKWLVDRRNPLTARVWVNRLWETLFGNGLVRTSEEFGAQGERPTHPELLDWLAVEFMDSGWNTKRILRLIVTSQTYQQTSEVSQENWKRDSANRWLARGPRVRLSAEMVRDQALAAAGLLSGKMFGPPVQPPQPDLGLKAAFGSKTDWETSQGEDRYRRALYTKWRRSSPYPSLMMFDAPSREVCMLRREQTNTPLQALVTLNDPSFFEAAQALAAKVTAAHDPKDTALQISEMFRLATNRPPSAKEAIVLLKLYDQALEQLEGDDETVKSLAGNPPGKPQSVSDHHLAALASVGNVILNLDEVLMKR
jgi:mono/diheme cytochrome c family protein